MNWPRITVVTPSFNQAQFLELTMRSVIGQNYPNLEYFIIDGGSTDGSVELIRKYAAHLDYWVSEKDDGQSDAIARGFDRASGELLGWLNSDDVYFPGALHAIGRACRERPGASIYAGGTAIGADGDGGIKKCSVPPHPRFWFPRMGLMSFGQQASFYSREVYRRIGGLSRHLYMRMDADLWRRLYEADPRAEVISEMVGFIRFHEATKSSTARDRWIAERDDWLHHVGVSKARRFVFHQLHRCLRLFDGSLVESAKHTLRYRGKRMEAIWREHDRLAGKG